MKFRFVGRIGVARAVVTCRVGAQVVDWVSVGTGGAGVTGDSGLESSSRAISAGGRYVVSESTTANFADGDDNDLMDVYVAHGPAALWFGGFESGDTTAWSATTSDIAPPDTASGIEGG